MSDDDHASAHGNTRALHAFASLYETNRRRVYHYLLSRIRDRHTAEDLCHDVFTRAWEGRERIARDRPIGPWLFGICRNIAYEHHRRRQRFCEVPWHDADDLPSTDPAPGERLELNDLIRPCLPKLSSRHARILDLRYAQGLTIRQIADQLAYTPASAKVVLHRARKALRQCVESRLGLYTTNYSPRSENQT